MESFVSVIYVICSFISTIFMGRGKYFAFIFAVIASLLYSLLAIKNSLWGSVFLSIFFYVPIEALSLYKWFKNTNSKTKSVNKLKLGKFEFLLYMLIASLLSMILSYILFLNNDKLPVLDGFITVFSILASILTMKRLIEQWIVWTIANILTFLMWIILIIQGSPSVFVAILWGVYVILGIVFYFQWKKEFNSNPQ